MKLTWIFLVLRTKPASSFRLNFTVSHSSSLRLSLPPSLCLVPPPSFCLSLVQEGGGDISQFTERDILKSCKQEKCAEILHESETGLHFYFIL